MKLKEAIREAVIKCTEWMNGAVVVKDGDNYAAIPGAYLTDASYTGSREVVVDLKDDISAGILSEEIPEDKSAIDWVVNRLADDYYESEYHAAEAAAEQAAEQAAHMAFHFPGSHGPKAWMYVDGPEERYERELEDIYWQESKAAREDENE